MEETKQAQIGIHVEVNEDFNKAIELVTAALKTEGFGVLTEIDVKHTLKQKLDVDFRPYKILGACNPSLAHRALTIAPEIGLLLPCNVVVSQGEKGKVTISLVDPLAMMGVVTNHALHPIAEEAAERLQRVADALKASA